MGWVMSKRQPIPNAPKHALEDAYQYFEYIQRMLKPLMVDDRQQLPTRTTTVVRASKAFAAAARAQAVIAEAHPNVSKSKRSVEV